MSALESGTPARGVLDVHHHVGVLPGAEVSVGNGIDEDALARRTSMDEFDIAQACLMPSHSYPRVRGSAEVRIANETTAMAARRDPARFPLCLGTTDVWLGDDAVIEATYALDELHVDGLSWHHRLQGVYIDDPRMGPLLDLLAERGKVAAIHVYADSSFEAPWRLENLAEAHRDVRFLALDAFSSYAHSSWMLRLGTHHPNIWFDTATMATTTGFLAQFMETVGPDRLVAGTNNYGSANPDYQPTSIVSVRESRVLTVEQKRRILGDNARRLFGLPLD